MGIGLCCLRTFRVHLSSLPGELRLPRGVPRLRLKPPDSLQGTPGCPPVSSDPAQRSLRQLVRRSLEFLSLEPFLLSQLLPPGFPTSSYRSHFDEPIAADIVFVFFIARHSCAEALANRRDYLPHLASFPTDRRAYPAQEVVDIQDMPLQRTLSLLAPMLQFSHQS
jgi:hypothetical protein